MVIVWKSSAHNHTTIPIFISASPSPPLERVAPNQIIIVIPDPRPKTMQCARKMPSKPLCACLQETFEHFHHQIFVWIECGSCWPFSLRDHQNFRRHIMSKSSDHVLIPCWEYRVSERVQDILVNNKSASFQSDTAMSVTKICAVHSVADIKLVWFCKKCSVFFVSWWQ